MNKVKAIAMGIMFALVTLIFVGCASAAIIYVPDDYAKIQWAVDSASPGDTIIIRDGTYTENMNVSKSLTIRSENGSDFTIIQPENPNYHIFEVATDYVSINGFTVKGAPGWTGLPCAGIYLINANYCNISNNNASFNNWDGIYLSNSFYNNVTNNIVSDNRCGIFLNYSYNNYITNNNASSNLWDGFWLYESLNNTMVNNIVSNNDHGILLVRSYNNEITNNIVSSNKRHGIYIHASDNNSIISNNVWNNDAGIQLDAYSHSNNITNNNALNNDYGIYLYKSSNSNIYLNNFINNTDNVYSLGSTNIWNSTERITYTYNSSIYTNYLGNYWDDYTGGDANGDGIGDTPYNISSSARAQDRYPLMEPWSEDNILIQLNSGWNLISLPLMHDDSNVNSALSPINGNYSIVWAYNASDTADHWKKYDPGAPFGNDLTTMEAGKGIILHRRCAWIN